MGSITDNTSGGSYSYRSSKAALNMVTMSAARDLADRQICVVALHPGWVRTDMGGANGELSVEQAASILKQHLLGLSLADSGRFIDTDGTDIPW
jgi:NAD(P)-dependent dehydrogenase (short-subunit alcohol dehydrogenase family)